MPIQRIRDAEIRVRNRLSNGPQRAQSNVLIQSILRRLGRRKLPKICRYLAKRTSQIVNQGGTADSIFVLDRISGFCQGLFIL